MKVFDDWTVTSTYSIEGFQIDYPTGYVGNSIPSVARTGLVHGRVWCANSNNIISSVYIDVQSGLDGNAKISDGGDNSKEYSYYLSEDSPYHLVVLCDGDPFYGPTVLTNYYGYYNWACTTTGDQEVCAAS